MEAPKVFISYSHDSPSHIQWVLKLATEMRNHGIDTILDQWELKPGDDLPSFMESNLDSSDRIVIICSTNYVEKANAGAGGVGYEKMIITARLVKHIQSNKFIPIIKQEGSKSLPTFLGSRIYINFSEDHDFRQNFDELIRTIHQSPQLKKPPIGKNPFINRNASTEPKVSEERKTQVGVPDLMKVVAYNFETGTTPWVTFGSVKESMKISSIYLGKLIDDAVQLGYLELDRSGDLNLTEYGEKYAADNLLF